MSVRVVAGVQARCGSTRLPRKVLADLAGRTLIERVVERAWRARLVDRVVVLTSTESSDDELAALCEARDIEVRRGSEGDVLSRYLALEQEFRPKYLVRITGDCPLIEPAVVDAQLQRLLATGADFTRVEARDVEGTLCGMGVLSARALRIAAESDDPRDREHVGAFTFQRERERFRSVPLTVDPVYERTDLRLTVDEPADLELMRAVYAHFARVDGRARFTTAEAIRWLDAHPEVAALNAAVGDSADNRALRALKAGDGRD